MKATREIAHDVWTHQTIPSLAIDERLRMLKPAPRRRCHGPAGRSQFAELN
jgi:hypothetical protein